MMNGNAAFKALLRVKLAGLFSGLANAFKGKGKKGKAAKTVLYAILLVVAFATLMLYFGVLCFAICEPFCESGVRWFYFGFTSILALIMCFVGSVFTTQAYIYRAKDNDLLLSMPIKPSHILFTRVLSVLTINYLYAFLVLIPAGVVYAILYTPSVIGVLLYILCSLVLPLLSQALASLVAWLLEVVTSRLKNKNVFTVILSLVGFGLYFVVVGRLGDYITKLSKNGYAIAASVKKAFVPAFFYGDAIAEHNALSLLAILAVCIVPFAVSYYLLSKNFTKLVSMKRTAAKKEYVEKKLNASNPRTAIMMKDLRKFLTSPTYLLNGGLGGLFAVAVGIILSTKAGELMGELAPLLLGLFVDFEQIAAILISVVISLSLCLNCVSAPSVSLEGKTLWQLKTIPVRPKEILLGKALTHIVVTAPFAVIASVAACIGLHLRGVNMLFVFVLPLAFTVLGALFGVFMNLQLPKLSWDSEAKVIKQSGSVLAAMFIPPALIIGLGALYIFAANKIMSVFAFAWAAAGFIVLLDVLLYLYMCTAGEKRFSELGN